MHNLVACPQITIYCTFKTEFDFQSGRAGRPQFRQQVDRFDPGQPCQICGGQNGTGSGFYRVLRFSPVALHRIGMYVKAVTWQLRAMLNNALTRKGLSNPRV